jgi:sec-independent protein translocase protein TatA
MVGLFINSIAGSEIIVILLFVLIFFGAKSIPGMSRSLGRGLRHIRDASQEVQNEIRKTTGDMRTEMSMKRRLDQLVEDVADPLKTVTSTIEKQASNIEKETGLKGAIPHQKKTIAKSSEKTLKAHNLDQEESLGDIQTGTDEDDQPPIK